MKINNKGFAISSMMYGILLLFLMLVLGVFMILGNRKMILDKVKNEITTDLIENKAYTLVFDYHDILLSNTSKVSDFTFDLLDGVRIIDQNGNVIETDITVESSPTFDSTVNGEYTITYKANYEGYALEEQRVIEVVDPSVSEYSYTGAAQQFNTNTEGLYRAELWGAQGGTIGSYAGGKGAYTSGNITLEKDANLYIYVGSQPAAGSEEGGYNGGGTLSSGQKTYGASGGGATDIRLNNAGVIDFDSLKSRIMVAAGGGGANSRGGNYGEGIGGAGGTLTGVNGQSINNSNGYGYGIGQGGTQTAGGKFSWTAGTNTESSAEGIFGQGGGINVVSVVTQSGGGSGYYGGSGSVHGGAGGGSSYISGYTGCNSVSESSTLGNISHTNESTHYSYRVFANGIMKAGNEQMPSHNGTTTITGNTGNGYAKITALIIDNTKVTTE